MVRITKVYTKTGDKGATHLAGGRKVSKISPRIEAYGGVDELNAQLGMVVESLKNIPQLQNLQERMSSIQHQLFDLGSQLAVLPEDRRENTPHIKPADIERLESEIDEMNAQLPVLESFVLPGGGEISSRLHVARAVCRRVEREVIRLSIEESLDGIEIPFLNRLSDWLFVASRFAAIKTANSETLWKPGKR